jgi:hypothetical protein
MNITKVAYTRKFNLGNYETLDLSIEAVLNEKDNPLEVWSILSDNAEMWFISERNKKAKTQVIPQQPAPQATQAKSSVQAIENVRKRFPEDLENRLDFEEKDGCIIVKGKQFLGSEAFREVLDTVISMGGKYIPASNNAHPYFTIPAGGK